MDEAMFAWGIDDDIEVPGVPGFTDSGSLYPTDLKTLAFDRQQYDWVQGRVLKEGSKRMRDRYAGHVDKYARNLYHASQRHDIDYSRRIKHARQTAHELRYHYPVWHNYGKFHTQHKRK